MVRTVAAQPLKMKIKIRQVTKDGIFLTYPSETNQFLDRIETSLQVLKNALNALKKFLITDQWFLKLYLRPLLDVKKN